MGVQFTHVKLEAQPDFNHSKADTVVILPGKDSTFLNPVYFITEEKENFFYSCFLKTPVCNDTLCQVVQLQIYWDLAGNYIKFDTLDGYPLTKFDHLPFTHFDYQRLHYTLRDINSVLGRTSEAELVDETQTRYSEKIDGVTGATSIQIKNSVVEGAMYSTYTLWHLINGLIRQKLQNYTLKNYSPDIENQLLGSGISKMIILALKQWKEQDYIDRFDEIILLMRKSNPLVNFYIAKNLSARIFQVKENQESIDRIWEILDPNTKSILSDYIKSEKSK